MSEERRKELIDLLHSTPGPFSGTELGQRLGATRQTVVQDIAILRARGEEIVATSRGYLLASSITHSRHQAILAVRHPPEESEDELSILLGLGIRVVDVAVEHPIYGELRGTLMLDSLEDLREWLKGVRDRRIHMLSELTDGVHLHTVEAPRAELLDRAREALRAKGYLLDREGN